MADASCNAKRQQQSVMPGSKRMLGSIRLQHLGYLIFDLWCDSYANALGNVVIQEDWHVAFWSLMSMSAGNSIMLLCNLCCGCICFRTAALALASSNTTSASNCYNKLKVLGALDSL